MTRETNKFTFSTDNDNDNTSGPMENMKKRGLTSNSETSECSVHSLSKKRIPSYGSKGTLLQEIQKNIITHQLCDPNSEETPQQLQYTESVMQRDKSSLPQPAAPDKLPVQQEVGYHSLAKISSLNSLSDRFSFEVTYIRNQISVGILWPKSGNQKISDVPISSEERYVMNLAVKTTYWLYVVLGFVQE